MTQYLLTIHIGPMQEFIEAARRTRDLWFGSWLMSELSKAVAHSIASQLSEDSLIFPAASLEQLVPGSELSVANKIVAIISGEPEMVASKAKESLYNRLHELAKAALLAAAKGSEHLQSIAQAQIEDLPEFYWVAVPYEDGSYAQARKQADKLLAARKNGRIFSQPSWSSNAPKSSLDGNRESIIPEGVFDIESPQEKAQLLYGRYRARPAERLSGVDLLKRLGQSDKGDRFPSTSHMAALPLKEQLAHLDEAKVSAYWQHYLAKLPGEIVEDEQIYHELKLTGLDHADGSLLFESRLSDYFDPQAKEQLKEAKQALAHFYKHTGLDAPHPYYAILKGDGDSIGKALNKQKDEHSHRKLSLALGRFADQARQIVRDYNGAVIYAGGDDLLALLPLHQVVDCGHELADSFTRHMQYEKHEGLTFSAGIVIFHHLEPLEDALKTVRRAEKMAKAFPGKNALAIIEAKRSGEERAVVGQWQTLVETLNKLKRFYVSDDLPRGLAYQLRDMAAHLGVESALKQDQSAATNQTLLAILQTEAMRIIKRKEGSKQAQNFVEKLIPTDGSLVLEQVINQLIIANNIAVAEKQAQKAVETKQEEAPS